MPYSAQHPVRRIAGRLALDFVNTADWSETDTVVQEHMESLADLQIWCRAAGLPDALLPDSLQELHELRSRLRLLFLPHTEPVESNLGAHIKMLQTDALSSEADIRRQPIASLIAVSAMAILGDPLELDRVKKCPGPQCGWLFLDETKNARRKWCMMETCGNRAKAARNYAKKSKAKKSA